MNDRTKDYVFISYSHANDIDPITSAFDKQGYNVVFDNAMSYGEEWDLNARRYISSERCKGVLIVVSEKSLTSKPVLTEIEYTARFRKKFFCIMTNNLTLMELYNSIADKLDENKRYVLDSIMEYLSDQQLFVRASGFDWARIKETFAQWGFSGDAPQGNEDFVVGKYTSEIKGEKERLFRQQKGYYNFDMRAINGVFDELGRDDLCILDLGCSNGALTISRFASDSRIKKVIGVDYNERDIEEAKAAAEGYGDRFAFYRLDLEDKNVISELNSIFAENGIEKIDLVFAALVLHHLKNPKLLLLKLYDIFSDDGKIIIRGSDDGGKLCYPETELLNEIIERSGKLITNSDRSNGRKLYSQLYGTGYVGIRMLYSVTDTCEKDRKRKENLFDVGFKFRLNRIDDLIKLNPDNEFLKSERAWMEKALTTLKEAFCERDFWYCNTSYIAVAGVK